MNHTSCLVSPARALHRVLLIELSNTAKSTTCSTYAYVQRPTESLRHARTGPVTITPPCRLRGFSSTSPARRVVKQKLLRDHQIPYPFVRIRDEETGVLSPPQRADAVRENLRKGETLIMVAPPPPFSEAEVNAPGRVLEPRAAICRILDAEAAQKMLNPQAFRDEVTKLAAQHTKELELNWAIAPHDQEHKLKRLTEFLGKGLRVQLLLAPKKRGRRATPEEVDGLLAHIKEAVAAVPGSTEYKKTDGRPGPTSTMTMFFEGPLDKRKVKKVKVDKNRQNAEPKAKIGAEAMGSNPFNSSRSPSSNPSSSSPWPRSPSSKPSDSPPWPRSPSSSTSSRAPPGPFEAMFKNIRR
ncbi:hypothetical protein GGS20DRAFT_585139 [Poronia punctata]|nr:hypothetical protein GGS20DRAFT_585139 [Poronia punctata]